MKILVALICGSLLALQLNSMQLTYNEKKSPQELITEINSLSQVWVMKLSRIPRIHGSSCNYNNYLNIANNIASAITALTHEKKDITIDIFTAILHLNAALIDPSLGHNYKKYQSELCTLLEQYKIAKDSEIKTRTS